MSPSHPNHAAVHRANAVAAGAPLPPDEAARVEALRATQLLDTEPDELFDRIVRIVCTTLNVPVSLVSLVDSDRQWFRVRCGTDARGTARDVSSCAIDYTARTPAPRDLLVLRQLARRVEDLIELRTAALGAVRSLNDWGGRPLLADGFFEMQGFHFSRPVPAADCPLDARFALDTPPAAEDA